MSKFMLIFRGGGYSTPGAVSPTELQAHLARWTAWSESLEAGDRMRGGTPLAYPPAGKTVRGTDKVVTDGPYAETKDLVSGIAIIEAATLEEATQLAKGCPILEHDSGSVEVRNVMDGPPG